MARVGGAVGVQIAKRMVLLGEMITAQELIDSGFLYKIAEPEELDAVVEALVQRASENAAADHDARPRKRSAG